ncbi:MAG TPA: epimerase [Burkholderiales bacterium]
MRVALFGATGMVGASALIECLADPRVESVIAVGRRRSGTKLPKVTEIVHSDFFDFRGLEPRFADCDACFFCLGVSAAGMSEEAYYRLTYELTLSAARSVLAANAKLTFCYVSGAGTDSTERGRSMWARVKGKTENALLAMPFKAAFMLRPAYIQPLRGVQSKTPQYRAFYSVLGPLYPVLRRLAPSYVTTSVDLGRALIRLAAEGYPRPILYTEDINRLALGAVSRG